MGSPFHGAGGLPYGVEAVRTGVEHPSRAGPPQVPHKGAVRVDAPHVRVDQHLIISAVQAVVESRPVRPYYDPGYPEQGLVVHRRETAPGLDAMPELLFLAPESNVLAVGEQPFGSLEVCRQGTVERQSGPPVVVYRHPMCAEPYRRDR